MERAEDRSNLTNVSDPYVTNQERQFFNFFDIPSTSCFRSNSVHSAKMKLLQYLMITIYHFKVLRNILQLQIYF